MLVSPRAERIVANAEPEDQCDPDVTDPEQPKRPRLDFRRAGNIELMRPQFLWHRYLVRGGLHLLIARQGWGKSTVVAWIAANINIGLPLPGDTSFHTPSVVAMLSLEEPDDRLVARLAAAGADLESVFILGNVVDIDEEGHPYRRPWRLPLDCAVLERFIVEHDIAFVTIDGLGYSVVGDSHNYANVGSALTSLAGVAERTGAAILGLTHPPKGGTDAVTAAIGSTAWTSVPRICWVGGKDPDDENGDRRVMSVSKSNFWYPDKGVAFLIGNDEEHACGYVTKIDVSTVSPDVLTAAPESADDRSEQVEIADLLREMTKEAPIAVDEVRKTLKIAGYEPSDRTLRRARARAGLVAIPPALFGGKRSFGRPDQSGLESEVDR